MIRPLSLLILACLAIGCPRLPPVSGCTPTSQRCDGLRPQVCSASQRWEPAGDVPCDGVCVVTAGVAHCATAPEVTP